MKLSLTTCFIKPLQFLRPLLILLGVFSLSSCGGGGGGGSKGGGQKPDPVAVDLPIAYIERPIPKDEDGNPVYPDLFDPSAFNPGAKVLLKDRATALATAVDITQDAFKNDPNYDPAIPAKGYDVKDLSASADGKKLVFAMRAPEIEGADPEDQPTWNIWEYNLATKTLRRVISSDIVAEAGQDVSPHYLSDGSIVFSSTRQSRSKAVLLDDGKPQFSALEEGGDMPAYELQTMKSGGSGIEQITYNQSHDLQPTVLQNGRVLYTRWDQFGSNRLSFYTANPDGTQVERSYGYFSLNGTPAVDGGAMNRLFKPLEMGDGRIAAILRPNGALLGGDMVVIDVPHFFENDLQVPAGGGTGSAQNPISILPINIKVGTVDVPEFSKHGRFAALAPLFDGTNRLLVSWSQCRLVDPKDPNPTTPTKFVACTDTLLATPGILEAPALYGIWIYNVTEQSQQPVVLAQEGKMFTDPVTIEVRVPSTYKQPNIDPSLAKESVGMLHIRSVYDFDGVFANFGFMAAPASLTAMAQAAPDERPARFVRFIKAVSIPDEDTQDALADTTYGALFNGFTGRREILGYAPVEPDGSVKVKVPADVAFTLEVLDKDGKRIGATKNHWLQLRPGEVRECNGCHVATNVTSGHGRVDAEAASINLGAATSGVQFPNTLRFDKLGTPEAVVMGETMAEFASRSTWCMVPGDAATCAPFSSNAGTNLRAPSVDLVFDDEWTDTAVRPKSMSFAYRYKDLALVAKDLHAPTSEGCMEENGWNSICRVIINYEQNIQHIWEHERPTGACVTCHASSVTDADGNTTAQIPSGQLDLGRAKAAADEEMLSYNQLTSERDKQILTEGGTLSPSIPVCEFKDGVGDNLEIQACVVTLDANGRPTCVGVTDCPFEPDTVAGAPAGTILYSTLRTPIPLKDTMGNPVCEFVDTSPTIPACVVTLDANQIPTCAGVAMCQFEPDLTVGAAVGAILYNTTYSNPTPRIISVQLMAPMSRGGAHASPRFFNRFKAGGAHNGYLNSSELKLLAEWLDLRGNYYNNPFDSVEP